MLIDWLLSSEIGTIVFLVVGGGAFCVFFVWFMVSFCIETYLRMGGWQPIAQNFVITTVLSAIFAKNFAGVPAALVIHACFAWWKPLLIGYYFGCGKAKEHFDRIWK